MIDVRLKGIIGQVLRRFVSTNHLCIMYYKMYDLGSIVESVGQG